MLGQPDYCAVPVTDKNGRDNSDCADPRVSWFAYKVVTNPRCSFFWECRTEVGFSENSYRAADVGISD
jgi:hypothetical protein